MSRKRVDTLERKNAELVAQVAELKREVVELKKKLAKLEAKESKNSSNSHKPPSTDTPAQRDARNKKKQDKKRGKGRNRGGQPGHPGHQRALQPAEEVDEFFDHRPSACNGCGSTELTERTDLGLHPMQQIEVPAAKPTITEHRRHAAQCRDCGQVTRAGLPSGVLESSFGPNVHAMIALLTGSYNLSRRDACRLLSEVYGIELSVGALSRCEERVSEALAAPVEEARAHVRSQPVKHLDATGWLNQGKGRQAWALVTPLVVTFFITLDGTKSTVKKLVGKVKGILVSDRATVFNFWAIKRRQICWAHLLRKFVAFAEKEGLVGILGEELVLQTQRMFHYWHCVRDGTLSRAAFRRELEPSKDRLETLLELAVACNIREISGSCKNILEHRDALWTFVRRTDVEPTNNAAERALRGLVLWRKRSYGSQSERGERFTERMLTVVESLRRQERDVLSYLSLAIERYASRQTPPSLLPH